MFVVESACVHAHVAMLGFGGIILCVRVNTSNDAIMMQICSRCNIIMPDDKQVETLLPFLTFDRLDVCDAPY